MKEGFDEHEQVRKAIGMLGHYLSRAENDPNLVSAYVAVGDVEATKAFAESAGLGENMQGVGVTGPPEMTWMTPVREAMVWDRELPAFLLSHNVADFDAWLEAYDAADDLRRFLANPELEAAMKQAGVTSEPDVSFHTGGWAKMY